jgi:predicted RNase H-like HicB family nuclease
MYMITAISPEGAVSFHSKTPAEALQTAVELMGIGLEGGLHHRRQG